MTAQYLKDSMQMWVLRIHRNYQRKVNQGNEEVITPSKVSCLDVWYQLLFEDALNEWKSWALGKGYPKL
jgi:hypothetical protein